MCQAQTSFIKSQLTLKNIKQKDIAEDCNIHPSSVAKIISGKSRSKKVETFISKILKIPRKELFENLKN